MAALLLKFKQELNVSLTKGDRIYGASLNSVAGFEQASMDDLIYLGPCSDLGFDTSDNTYAVLVNPANEEYVSPNRFPSNITYAMFSKNNIVNIANVKGYYAELEFINNSTEKAELFSVGVGVEQSSK